MTRKAPSWGVPLASYLLAVALSFLSGSPGSLAWLRTLQSHTGRCECDLTIVDCQLAKGPPEVSECCGLVRDPRESTVDKLFIKWTVTVTGSDCTRGPTVVDIWKIIPDGGSVLVRSLVAPGDSVEWDLKNSDGKVVFPDEYFIIVSTSVRDANGTVDVCLDFMDVDIRDCQAKVAGFAAQAQIEGPTTRGIYLGLLSRVAGKCLCSRLHQQLENPSQPPGPFEDPCGILCVSTNLMPKISDQLRDPNSCINKYVKAGEGIDEANAMRQALSQGGGGGPPAGPDMALLATGLSAGQLAALQGIARCEDQMRADAMKACGMKKFTAKDKDTLGACITAEVQATLSRFGAFFARVFGVPDAKSFLENSEKILEGGSP